MIEVRELTNDYGDKRVVNRLSTRARCTADHLEFLARSNGIGRRRVAEVLEEVGLSEMAGKRIEGFSLGMQQRLGVADASLRDPGVLLLDDPV